MAIKWIENIYYKYMKRSKHKPITDSEVAIGQKVFIKRELRGDEDVTVEGRIEGKIKLNKYLIINKGSVVKAEVSADWLTVSGKLIGNVNARTKL